MEKKHIFILVDCTLDSGVAQRCANATNCIFVNYDTITKEFQDFFTKSFGKNQSQMNLNAIYAMGFRTSLKTCKDVIACGKDVILCVPSPAYYRERYNFDGYRVDVNLPSQSTDVSYIMVKQGGFIDSETLEVSEGKYTIECWHEGEEENKEITEVEHTVDAIVDYVSSWISKNVI